MKTAILIHGCHLFAKEWENIVWGNPEKGILGRIPKGIELAYREDANLIFWGTGASEKDGAKEAEYTFRYAVSHGSELSYFQGLKSKEIEKILRPWSFIDTETQNTPQEVDRAVEVCKEKRIERLILVSSPTHIARCHQRAMVLKADGKTSGMEIYPMESDTCYADSKPSDVFILEPPHRGDRPEVPLNQTLNGVNAIRKNFELAPGFNTALAGLIEEWKKKL